ncbi:hypothetical protein WR25_13290 [Diploscapter pachys]|uniref:Isoleucine--tRNA ligase, cytoplasmic n=1 Tax=Diploscapter pachys TaxID=2018661 RepID=A0A2A2JRJ1_9BILA|nr:hypothetical protein WR25_13290 [Diploscapter pachys]
MSSLSTVPDNINFAQEEEKILAKWRQDKVFERSVELSKDRPRYSFFDGPPFATGLPHYGHILAGTIKDVVTRWAHQNGYFVERRFGWDTHGLPVEFEVDKTLGINGPADILAMGIDKYNDECRKIVMRYSKEWEESVGRVGRWIDFRHDYKTMYPWFMESVWWAFSELFKKGLVYRGVKVMPFSTACSTPLSNFEAGQNYKDVVDPAVFVGLRLDENPNRLLVAWTTTPWTLPSNLAICVHPDLEYVVAKDKNTNVEYVMLEVRLPELKNENLEIIEKIDFATCLEHGIIAKDMKIVCPVDEKGKFTSEVTDFEGMYVKDADKLIVKKLKEMENLVKESQVKHSYPFCWRSDTPLLYKAVPSWFIRVESIVPKLLANNDQTYWVPAFVKEKRFANWLKDARDWAVSRNRFWGTPINLWVSDDGEEVVAIGSIKELEELSGQKITDLHRENVDHITIPSKMGKGVLKRVSEVFDCWFESGSMPYAQNHYPFENRKVFEENFPADFIAEGIDQTRGWFYTLLVLSTALFGKPPFKNLICNGLVLASDGNKMSKRKKNYPDPMEIVRKYGADALRLYLINSPVVRGENLRFREEGVHELLKDVFLPWFNAYRFLIQNVQLYEHETGQTFSMQSPTSSENVMDKWIESFTNSLIQFVRNEMAAYRLYAVVVPLTKFFEILTNCYIRLNRKRIKGEDGVSEQLHAMSALSHVLLAIVRLMAPFSPFFCEYIWQNLRKISGDKEESVHYMMLPQANEQVIDKNVERRVQAMQDVIDLVRVLRERKAVPVKYPLKEMVVINRDSQFLEDVKSLEPYVLSELNADPNFRLLGARLKGDQKKVTEYLKNQVTEQELEQFLISGKMTVLGHELTSEEVSVSYANTTAGGSAEASRFETHSDAKTIVMVDMTEDEGLVEEGLAREIGSRVQKLRKLAKILATDGATAYVLVEPANCQLAQIVQSRREDIAKSTGTAIKVEKLPSGVKADADSTSNVKDAQVTMWLVCENAKSTSPAAVNKNCNGNSQVKEKIKRNWTGKETVEVVSGQRKVQLKLVTQDGSQAIENYSELLYEVRSVFGLWSGRVNLLTPSGQLVHPTTPVESLYGTTIVVQEKTN